MRSRAAWTCTAAAFSWASSAASCAVNASYWPWSVCWRCCTRPTSGCAFASSARASASSATYLVPESSGIGNGAGAAAPAAPAASVTTATIATKASPRDGVRNAIILIRELVRLLLGGVSTQVSGNYRGLTKSKCPTNNTSPSRPRV